MATIAENIKHWLDTEKYPPLLSDLPASVTIADGILGAMRDTLKESMAKKKERGSGIGFWDTEIPTLEFGKMLDGDEDSISTSSTNTPMGSTIVGTFHTHPNRDGFSAPSPADLVGLLKSAGDVLMLVASLGWTYLLVRTKETKVVDEKWIVRLHDLIVGQAIKATEQARREIREELSRFTSDTSLCEENIRQIGYERAFMTFLRMLKVGYYTGQDAVLIRRC